MANKLELVCGCGQKEIVESEMFSGTQKLDEKILCYNCVMVELKLKLRK